MKLAAVTLFAVACFAAALAWFAPATLVDQRLAQATAGKLRLADAAGTVWNGRGIVADSSGRLGIPVAWRASPTALLRGVVRIELQPMSGATTPTGLVELADGTVALRAAAVEASAQSVASVLPGRALPALGGTLSASAPAFAWSKGGGSGTMDVRWHGARLVVGDLVANLGNVELAIAPQGSGMNGRLASSGGDVRVDGTLSLTGASLSVDATVTPAPTAPPQLALALAAL
ncbi:MAG: type II secretion system protein N, partial [Burkholderiales bacterium]|nr:type II secretion system protein N [Burkholderiales bacterium]